MAHKSSRTVDEDHELEGTTAAHGGKVTPEPAVTKVETAEELRRRRAGIACFV